MWPLPSLPIYRGCLSEVFVRLTDSQSSIGNLYRDEASPGRQRAGGIPFGILQARLSSLTS